MVPTWLGGMTVLFLFLMPVLKAVFPKTCKKEGVFLLAFELTCAGPVRGSSVTHAVVVVRFVSRLLRASHLTASSHAFS